MNKSTLWRRLLLFGLLLWGIFHAFQDDWFILQCLAVGVVLGLAIRVVILPFQIKRAMLESYNSLSHRPAHPDEFPLLDASELDLLTREWEALGFVQVGGVASGEAKPRLGVGFSQMMKHSNEGVLVEINQLFLSNKALPFFSTVISFWGEDERDFLEQTAQKLHQSAATASPLASPSTLPLQKQQPLVDDLKIWMLITHNRAPNRLQPLLRHPRILGARLEKGASPAQLWQAHQERFALVNARLGTTPLRGDLLALLHTHALVFSAVTAQRLQTTSVWKIARVQFFSKAPAPTFDGELAPLGC